MTDYKLSEKEIEQLSLLLSKLEPGFLPYDVFVQIARLTVLSIIEFVPIRLSSKGKAEVLLLSRGSNDAIWPGELHTPGTVIRPTDTEGKMYLAFDRIINDELEGVKASSPYYVGSNLHKSKRGMEQAQVFWVEVLEEPSVGSFYEADKLPELVMKSQVNFIKQAVKSFQETKGQAS